MGKMFCCLILAGISLGVAGCRADKATQETSRIDAGTGPVGAKAPPPAPMAEDLRPLLVCFGDSLTAGYGAEAGQSYPDYLQKDLDARGYKYRVVNEGISGNTTKDGVERVEHIAEMKPALVVVEFGGNDGLRGLRIEDTRRNMDQIVSTLKASGTKVVLAGITLPPDYGPDYVKQFNDTYTLLAKQYKVPMLPFLLKDVFGVPGMMQADQTHATAKGNAIVAKNVLPLVTPLLKK
jgi:acyl-CoA thioesterase I